MNRVQPLQSYIRPSVLLGLGLSALVLLAAAQAVPFTSATVTRVENRVSYGERHGDQSSIRPAAVMDTLKGNDFLLTETESRAELQYPDGSVVRVGQNAVFSFDSDTRTLSLSKGSLLFHIPKGAGGGTIKTPSMTAAITGTAGKVSTDLIAIIEGVVKLIPSGRLVHAGEFARFNADGTITIAKFDPNSILEGKLVNFNGLMPGFEEVELNNRLRLTGQTNLLETLEDAQNQPASIIHFFPPIEPPYRHAQASRDPNVDPGRPSPRRRSPLPRPIAGNRHPVRRA